MYEKWEMHQTLPQEFVENITIDENGYPVYRRRDDGKTIMKLGIDLDNGYVIPYNRYLLMRYGAHINVEWHNQSRSIKYLFKDEHDEVSMYYDCRYISPCKAAWRIFGYNIHYRDPSVVRLGFHLPNEQPVVFRDDENSEDISRKASVKESMFLEWFEVNKSYPKTRSLTYVEFPTKFVWKAKERKLFPRKSLAVIGHIFFVPLRSGESYYLRLLFNYAKGPKSYEEIRTIDGVLHSSFRDACYAQCLLDDDREYIDAIEKSKSLGS